MNTNPTSPQAGRRFLFQGAWKQPSELPAKISLEFREGHQAYADGIDGYAATPYQDGTQEMTDWFAGWIDARNANRNAEQVAA